MGYLYLETRNSPNGREVIGQIQFQGKLYHGTASNRLPKLEAIDFRFRKSLKELEEFLYKYTVMA